MDFIDFHQFKKCSDSRIKVRTVQRFVCLRKCFITLKDICKLKPIQHHLSILQLNRKHTQNSGHQCYNYGEKTHSQNVILCLQQHSFRNPQRIPGQLGRTFSKHSEKMVLQAQAS